MMSYDFDGKCALIVHYPNECSHVSFLWLLVFSYHRWKGRRRWGHKSAFDGPARDKVETTTKLPQERR